MRVTICGGGNLAHILAAVVGADSTAEVRVLTRRPGPWGPVVHAFHRDVVVEGQAKATSDPAYAITGAELIIIAAPAYAHLEILAAIAPHLKDSQWIGALPAPGGFDHAVRHVTGRSTRVFGSARSPYNGRIEVVGRSARVFGVVPYLELASVPRGDRDAIKDLLSKALGLPIQDLPRMLSATIAPSGTIFHTARLYELATNKGSSGVGFYTGWGDVASETYLASDDELARLAASLGLDWSGMPAADHYGTTAPEALTRRIRSISGLPPVEAPTLNGGTFNFVSGTSRFLLEDLPYGLKVLAWLGQLVGAPTPTISRIAVDLEQRAPDGTESKALRLPEYLRCLSLSDWVRQD